MRFRKPLLWFITCCAIGVLPLWSLSAQPRQTVSKPSAAIDFAALFELESVTTLLGTSQVPIFSVGDFAVTDSSFIIPDYRSHQILRYSRSGTFIDKWGREGHGPGEFTDPNWAGVDSQKRIFVREGGGNFRVQIFDESGTYQSSFPLMAFGPFTESYVISGPSGTKFVTTTRLTCNDSAESCAIQIQDETGEILRRFAPELEVQPDRKDLPFVAGRDEAGRYFVAHRFGNRVTVYSSEGAREFPIDESPETIFVDFASLPNDLDKRRETTKTLKRTMIRSIYPIENAVVIDMLRINPALGKSRYFLEVYNNEGEPIHYGINTELELRKVVGDRLFFITENTEAEYGAFEIHEYRPKTDLVRH